MPWPRSRPLQELPVPADVLSSLSALGIGISHVSGTEAVARCPAHRDRHPSWSVSLETGQHNCFSCGFSGSFVKLVVQVRNCSWSEAIEWTRSRTSAQHVATRLARREKKERRPEINEAALALFEPPPAWALKERGLSAEAAARYGVLWDPSVEHWILPIRTPDGTLMGYQVKGPGVFNNKPYGVKKGSTLFGIEHLDGGDAILIEAPLDVVRIATMDISGAVGSFGAKVTESQMQLLMERCERIIIALDNPWRDKAGYEMTLKLLETYGGVFPLRVFSYYTLDKDPGEMSDRYIRLGIREALPAITARRMLQKDTRAYERSVPLSRKDRRSVP